MNSVYLPKEEWTKFDEDSWYLHSILCDIEREKLDLRGAIVAASEKRLRPILLTSATTVLGLAPMAIAGGALWQPMAVLMMSGLAVASLLTLFFVPTGYLLLFRFDKKVVASGRS